VYVRLILEYNFVVWSLTI